MGEDNKLSLKTISRIAKNSVTYTKEIGKSLIKLIYKDTPRLIAELKGSITDALNGTVNVKGRIKGEIFLAGSLAYLLQGNYRGLEGPFAELWLDAWRLSFPDKLSQDATPEDIKALADTYDDDAFALVQQNVTAKFYEILETKYENADGDAWSAELIEEQNHPASDAIFFNSKTGRGIEINYKFTENKHYIESHIQEYPDVPVVAPADVAERINNPMVIAGNVDYEIVKEISEENFDELIKISHDIYLEAGAAAGGVVSIGIHALPFLIAYKKGNITREQLGKAVSQFLPELTGRTINRIAMLALLGPVYAMFLLANLGLKGTLFGFDDAEETGSSGGDERVPPKESKLDKKFSRRSLITLSFVREF